MTRSELNKINDMALTEASILFEDDQCDEPHILDAYTLLHESFPITELPLEYNRRIELFYYLIILEVEKSIIAKTTASDRRENKLCKLSKKIEEINQSLEWMGNEIDAKSATEAVMNDCSARQAVTKPQTESVANSPPANKPEAVTAFKKRKSMNDTDALVLLNAALNEMELENKKTPEWTELASYVLGDKFNHSNIQTACDKGQAISNRFHCLADGTKLTRERIRRTYKETIFRLIPP